MVSEHAHASGVAWRLGWVSMLSGRVFLGPIPRLSQTDEDTFSSSVHGKTSVVEATLQLFRRALYRLCQIPVCVERVCD